MIWLLGVIVAIAPSTWHACEGRVRMYPKELASTFYPTYFLSPVDMEQSYPTVHPTYFQSVSGASCKCGQKPGNRIVGGKETTPNEYPWQALFMYKFTGQQFCGGSIITKQWIISAAHCFGSPGTAATIAVALGEHDYSEDDPNTQKYDVEKIIKHEKYNEGAELNNDIAVVKLKTLITFNIYVSPICLPFNHVDDTWSGKSGTISGWGYTISGDTSSGSKVLKELDLKLLDNTDCTIIDGYIWWSFQVTKNMVCGVVENAGMCQGDSGGPLVWFNPDNGFYFQVGISSFVSKCAKAKSPDVFAKVSNYLDWVKEKTGAGNEMCVP